MLVYFYRGRGQVGLVLGGGEGALVFNTKTLQQTQWVYLGPGIQTE